MSARQYHCGAASGSLGPGFINFELEVRVACTHWQAGSPGPGLCGNDSEPQPEAATVTGSLSAASGSELDSDSAGSGDSESLRLPDSVAVPVAGSPAELELSLPA